MNKRVILIVVGILILIVAGYFIWRLLVPQFTDNQNGNGNGEGTASQEEIEEALTGEVSESTQAILGETVSIDKNIVLSVVSEDVLWLGPLGGEKNILVIENSENEFNEGDIVRVTGEIRRVADFAERASGWELTSSDLAIVSENPIVLDAEEIEVVD